MNREIEFRGMCINGAWVYGNLNLILNGCTNFLSVKNLIGHIWSGLSLGIKNR